jgi:hypothetical protein
LSFVGVDAVITTDEVPTPFVFVLCRHEIRVKLELVLKIHTWTPPFTAVFGYNPVPFIGFNDNIALFSTFIEFNDWAD